MPDTCLHSELICSEWKPPLVRIVLKKREQRSPSSLPWTSRGIKGQKCIKVFVFFMASWCCAKWACLWGHRRCDMPAEKARRAHDMPPKWEFIRATFSSLLLHQFIFVEAQARQWSSCSFLGVQRIMSGGCVRPNRFHASGTRCERGRVS